MSMSDDPRGFRRGQPANQRYPASQGREEDPRSSQRGDGRGAEDNYSAYRQPPMPPQGERQDRARDRQPTFSAYRPEAYASSSRGQSRPEQSQWDEPARSAPMPPQARHDPRDPYQGSGSADPYAPPQAQPQRHYEPPQMPQRGYEPPPAAPSSHDFEADWRQESYSERQQPDNFANYYQQRDDGLPDVDAQAMHNSYFAQAEPEPAAPPPPPRPSRSRMPEFNDFGDAQNDRNQAFGGGSENDQDYGWDNFDQTQQKAAARPFHPPVPVQDDDLDADFFADEDDFDGEDYIAEKGSGRKKLMAAVLVGAVVTGGGLAYVYKNNSIAGIGGEPLFVSADVGPVKETPSDPGGRDFPNGNKLIYDRLSGGGGVEPTRSDENQVAADGAILQGGVTSPGTLDERINQALRAQQANNANAGGGDLDAPRRVQTLTIRPDGSVDQPAQAVVSTQDIQTADFSNDVVISQQPEVVASADSSSNESLGDAPESQQADSGNSDSGSNDAAPNNEPVQVAAVAPQVNNSEVKELTGGSGEYFVQVGARNDQEAAETAFKTLQKKYAAVLGNHQNYVRKVDLGEKGVWYRLWVGPVNTKGDAEQLCSELKSAGMPDCLPRKDSPQ